MGKIKKILENELAGGTQTTDVYPVTSTKAVYDANNKRLDEILSASTEAIDGVTNKVTELELKVGGININVNFEEQTEDLYFLGTLENPIPINSTVVITIDTLEGSGLRLVLIKEDGTIDYYKLTLGTNSFNTSSLTFKGLALYHKANTGSLNVKGNIEFADGLISAINKIKDIIPDSATSINKLVTQEDIGDVVSKSDIVDNLQETRSDLVLSANQGKILNDKVEISLTEEYSIFNDYELVQGYWNAGSAGSSGGNPIDGESAGARHRTNKIPVIAGEEYLISGVVSSPATCLVYIFGGPSRGPVCVGTGTPITYTDYKLTIPQGCTDIGVQSNDPISNLVIKKKQVAFKAYTKQEADARFGTSGNGGLLYKTTEIIHLSDNVAVGDFTLAEGWDGDAVSGYTHSSGMNAISLNVQTTNGEVYLFEADVEIADSTIEFCKANFGNNPQCLTYNGTNHISVPLLSDGGQFILTPATTNTFKLSNITLQKISDEGIEKILNLYNIISTNHNKNYGFWNVLLGASSMQDAVGSTRTIAIGNFALNALKSGNRNIAVGTYSMNEMVNGENNIAIGADAMEYVKSAQNCVAIGKGIMAHGKSLNNNVAIGSGCINGSSDSESRYNIGIGFDAGYNIIGQSNTCIGYKAGESIGAGSANVAIGRSVSIGSGTNRNTCVGDRSSVAAGVSDSIAIGTLSSATKSNQMVLGSSSITEVVMCGNKKIIFNEDGSVTWETIS